MATLKELSEHTGYSPATISRILTGDPALAVTEEARKRVLEEAGRLNYNATRSRRGRATKQLLRVGLAEMLTPAQQLDDPYYLYLRELVESSCRERRYACVPLERKGGEFCLEAGETVDAVAAVGLFTAGEVESLAALSPSVVFLDSCPDEARFDSVVLNYPLGIALAVEELLRLGHSRIGFLGPERKLNDRKEPAPEARRACFRALMEERGLYEPDYVIDCPMDSRETARAVTAFLASGRRQPTAFVAANEENAIGAVRAFREAGVDIPGAVSVISFNDTPLSQLTAPPLTSVSTHLEELARCAVRLLTERSTIGGRPPERTLPLKVIVPPTLVRRESAGPPAAQGEGKETNAPDGAQE